MHENMFKRAKEFQGVTTASGWRTEMRRDTLKRVGSTVSHYSCHLSPKTTKPQHRDPSMIEKDSEVSPQLHCRPWHQASLCGSKFQTAPVDQDSTLALASGQPLKSHGLGTPCTVLAPNLDSRIAPAPGQFSQTQASGRLVPETQALLCSHRLRVQNFPCRSRHQAHHRELWHQILPHGLRTQACIHRLRIEVCPQAKPSFASTQESGKLIQRLSSAASSTVGLTNQPARNLWIG